MFCPCAFQFQLADNAHGRKVPCITVCPCGFDLLTKTRNAHRRNVHLHYNVAELL